MIEDTMCLRPRYGEVDKMGYVYHANYLSYCHQARNELLRKLGIHETELEKFELMLPVISFNIEYKKPAFYDELLTVITRMNKKVDVRINFDFTIRNIKDSIVCVAQSTVVFADIKKRFPKRAPDFIKKIFAEG